MFVQCDLFSIVLADGYVVQYDIEIGIIQYDGTFTELVL